MVIIRRRGCRNEGAKMIDVKKLADIYDKEFKPVGELSAHEMALLHVYDFGYGEGMTRTNPTLPEDVREKCLIAMFDAAYPYSVAGDEQRLAAIAPLIIEWARKDQAEVDARIAENWADANEVGGYARAAYTVARKLRAQFTPETTGGE
jgi:hypothetical protein